MPFQDSVRASVVSPPKANAAVFVPAPPKPKPFLPSFKSPTSVQLEPFHVSANAAGPFGALGKIVPPKANAAVDVPQPAKRDLALFKSPTSVQLVPSYTSAFATCGVAGA